jgi:uncharacterized protein (DUF58 family)
MNSKSLFINLIIFGLVFSALLSRSGSLLLLSLPFLAYLMVGVLQSPGLVRVSARRSVNVTGPDGAGEVCMQVTLSNQGETIRALTLSEPQLPGTRLKAGSLEQKVGLAAGEAVDLAYTLQSNRGSFTWESVHVCTSDPFELVRRDWEIPAQAEALVAPSRMRLRHIPLRPGSTNLSTGSLPARRAGSGTEFWGVREYHAGDSLHRLNWRLQARYPGRLFTNEFEREEIVTIGLILDGRLLTDVSGEVPLFEHSVRATASLAETFLREGNRVGLLVCGESLIHLTPRYGKAQLHQILCTLARGRTSPGASLENLKYLSVRLFPSRSQLILISPLAPGDLPIYTRLRAEGYPVLLLSPDPVAYGVAYAAPSNQQDRAGVLAVRAARMERRLQLRQLALLGVQVVDWPVDQPLSERLRAVLRGNTARLGP